jgi:DnaJ like chaperone protein
LGVLLVSPVLKILSVAAGYFAGRQFDRGFAAERHAFDDLGAGAGRLSDDYVRSLFRCMGHLAKADGRVSEEEIRAARLVMHRLNLSPAQVRKAIHWFDEGKQTGFPLVQTVRELRRVHARRADQRTELDIGRVELAQLEAMILAQKGFRRSPAGTADTARLRRAYATLGVDESSSNDEIKQAYRRLMNRNHPDKIAGSNPDESAIAEAQRRTREIRGAYEMLKARRSIR